MPTPDLLPILRDAATLLTSEELAAPLLIGVSGGPDSLALLHACWRWRDAGGPSIRALHVDHRLRTESAAEARRVAAWCDERKIPFTSRVVSLDGSPVANIEQVAREARYRCFAAEAEVIGARVLALAHHADDQAETLLLHLLRGSGLAGLAGMPPVRRGGDLLDTLWADRTLPRPAAWRPLLAVSRAAIVAYGERWGLEPIHDPSNQDTRFRRNALRQILLPALEGYFPAAGAILARNAALLAADEAVLQEMTAIALDRCAVRDDGMVAFDRAAFGTEPVGLQRRMLRAAWSQLAGSTVAVGPDADALEAAREGIVGGKTGARWPLAGDLLVMVERAEATVGPSADLPDRLRRRLGLPVVEPGWREAFARLDTVSLGTDWQLAITPCGGNYALHIPLSLEGLLLRTWQPGDRIALAGGRGSRKLQDWFTDRHIPAYARHHLPLLARGDRVLWILGLAVFPPLATDSGDAAVHAVGSEDCYAIRLHYNGQPIAPVRRGDE